MTSAIHRRKEFLIAHLCKPVEIATHNIFGLKKNEGIREG